MKNTLVQICSHQKQAELHYSIVLIWEWNGERHTTTTNYRLTEEIKPFPPLSFYNQLAQCLVHICRKIMFTHNIDISHLTMKEFTVQFIDDDITFFAKDLLPQIKETDTFQSFLQNSF